MAIERTLSIIKPDAVERNLVGRIIGQFEESGLRPVAIRRHHLSAAEAGQFFTQCIQSAHSLVNWLNS